MNYNRRVPALVFIFTALLLGFSILQYYLHWDWQPLQRINLVADIVKDSAQANGSNDSVEDEKIVVQTNGRKTELSLYKKGSLITDFNADTTAPSLSILVQKLYALKSGQKKKVRIAYFGDSMIEGDLITETLRKLLQQQFGGMGIGFVSADAADAGYRTTINHYATGWTDKSFKTESGSSQMLYVSGHTFYGSSGYITMTDKTIKDSTTLIEKSLLCGAGNTSILVNGNSFPLNTSGLVNRVPLDNSASHSIKVNVSSSALPVYGISFESESGVFVDNFSFRGISGVEFAKLDTALLRSVEESNAYDLIILQYGINQMFRPNDVNYHWYTKVMTPSVAKMRNAFSKSDMLIVSAGDRAFRYGDEYKTAIGIDSLIRIQALLADSAHVAFYNLYQSMGGPGTIVAWANATPSLANKDYIHPNLRGADILGHHLFDAIMKDYKKYNPPAKK